MPIPDAARGRGRPPALVARGLRPLATLVVETDEAREAHHIACLLGYGAEAICPRLALETVAALAAADRVGGDRPSPAEAQRALPGGDRGRRAEDHVQDGHRRRRGVLRRAGVRRRRSRRRRWSSSASPARPRRSAASASPSSSARPSSRARSTRLENPGYVKFRKGGEPHETGRVDVVERCARSAARRPERSAGTAYERFAALVDGRAPMELRDLLELAPGRGGAARRGRARGLDRAALLGGRDVARRAVGRGARDDRGRVQPASARGRTAARAERIRPGSAPSATRGSSRSRRAASGSRPSTPRSPTSSRSRSPRARSPARAASFPATRSRSRSRGFATPRRASR